MKKINYYLGALALATFGLASCSSDDLAGSEGPDTNVERTVYVNLSIHGDPTDGSRAAGDNGNPEDPGDFSAGTASESAVNTVYLVFYDDAGNVVGSVTQIEVGAPGTEDGFNNAATPSGTVESQLKRSVAVTLRQGQANPSQVMCYINPSNPSALQNPLYSLQTTTSSSVVTKVSDTESYFPMSNSIYYDTDGKLVMGVSIPVDAIFEKEQDAIDALESATGEDIIDIYVERYAAKLCVTGIDDATVTPYETAGIKYNVAENGTVTREEVPVVLTFNVTGWAVNGESKSTYLIKSFRESAQGGQILTENIPYNTINARINSATINYDTETGVITPSGALSTWVWNAPAYHRSYWALSPVYFQSEYPEVLSDYEGHESEYNQVFLSYNEITGEGGKAKLGFDGDDTSFHYFKETTSGYPALRSKNPNAAVASVAIVGRYSLTVNGTAAPANTSFYTYLNTNPNGIGNGNASVYFEVEPNGQASELASAVTGGTSMKERFLRQVTVLYENTAGEGQQPNFVRYSDLSALAAVTEITTPKPEVLTTTEVNGGDTEVLVAKFASRSRTLQIKSGATLTGIYINNQGTPMQIVADGTVGEGQISLTDANRILWQNVGTCNYYQLGSAFYDVPIKHLGWYRTDNPQLTSKQIDFSLVRLGDLGMVRNHSYTINIEGITGLAAGIGGVDDAIIPPADTKDVYMAYRVNILKWAVVPVQDVTLE